MTIKQWNYDSCQASAVTIELTFCTMGLAGWFVWALEMSQVSLASGGN